MAKLSPTRRSHRGYENWWGYATASIVQIIHSIHCNKRQVWIQTVVFILLPLIQNVILILLIVITTCKWMHRKFWRSERFLKALAKLRKATIRSVMSWNKSAPTGGFLMKFEIWIFFENLSRKFKFHYNLTRIAGTEDPYTRYIIPRSVFLRMKNAVKKSKHTFYVVPLIFFVFPSQNRAVYEIMWEHSRVGDGHKWQHGACAFHAGYLSYKHPLSENVTRNCHLLHQRLHERASDVTLYVHCLSCVTYRYT